MKQKLVEAIKKDFRDSITKPPPKLALKPASLLKPSPSLLKPLVKLPLVLKPPSNTPPTYKSVTTTTSSQTVTSVTHNMPVLSDHVKKQIQLGPWLKETSGPFDDVSHVPNHHYHNHWQKLGLPPPGDNPDDDPFDTVVSQAFNKTFLDVPAQQAVAPVQPVVDTNQVVSTQPYVESEVQSELQLPVEEVLTIIDDLPKVQSPTVTTTTTTTTVTETVETESPKDDMEVEYQQHVATNKQLIAADSSVEEELTRGEKQAAKLKLRLAAQQDELLEELSRAEIKALRREEKKQRKEIRRQLKKDGKEALQRVQEEKEAKDRRRHKPVYDDVDVDNVGNGGCNFGGDVTDGGPDQHQEDHEWVPPHSLSDDDMDGSVERKAELPDHDSEPQGSPSLFPDHEPKDDTALLKTTPDKIARVTSVFQQTPALQRRTDVFNNQVFDTLERPSADDEGDERDLTYDDFDQFVLPEVVKALHCKMDQLKADRERRYLKRKAEAGQAPSQKKAKVTPTINVFVITIKM